MTTAKATGAETKELLIQALRAKYWLLQRPEDVEQAFAEALAALAPCIVLTAEEAAYVRRHVPDLDCAGDAHALALLTERTLGVC